jgi:MFS family permease
LKLRNEFSDAIRHQRPVRNSGRRTTLTARTDILSATAAAVAPTVARTRWLQLGLGLVCMMTISSPQYVWTLMTKPLAAKLGVALPELQVTFSILMLLQAFFSPFQGALVDRFGPRRLISMGTLLAGLSWVLASYAHTASMLYLTYGGVGGLGTGIVYVGVVGLMVQWFPDRRGFAAGVVAAGYGMGAILTTFPIASSLAARGVDPTLWLFGIAFAAVGFVAAQGLHVPPVGLAVNAPSARTSTTVRDLSAVRNAQAAALLVDVRDDDDDGHLGPDGHVADGDVRRRLRGEQGLGVRAGRGAAGLDHRPLYERADPAVVRLGIGSTRP